jgi:hypothetical protein
MTCCIPTHAKQNHSCPHHVIYSNLSRNFDVCATPNIKPSNLFHPTPSPRAPPTLLVPLLPCPQISTISSACSQTPQRSKVCPSLLQLLIPLLNPLVPPVRKAYKKRALQTHPDRVPAEQKTTAEEEFRKVPRILVSSPPCRTHARRA